MRQDVNKRVREILDEKTPESESLNIWGELALTDENESVMEMVENIELMGIFDDRCRPYSIRYLDYQKAENSEIVK